MNISNGMVENIVKILVAKLPPETLNQIENVVKQASMLGAQLDRIERKLDALLQKENDHAREFVAGDCGNVPGEIRSHVALVTPLRDA